MVQAQLAGPAWSDWKALAPALRLGEGVLEEILDGGQSFRWHPDRSCGPGAWIGQWGSRVARLRPGPGGRVEWSAPLPSAAATQPELAAYLDAGGGSEADRLPWRSDEHLARCLEAFPGLRILRQPFGETLLCFLCSPTKRIIQIKRMVAALAERLGSPLPGPGAAGPWRRLPDWPELAGVPEAELRACALGFRARHVHRAAKFLEARPGWLEETEHLPYRRARERLCELPGVGEKVADCVLLFGAARTEAFPVDVWILRALERHYGLEGWRLPQLAQFGRAHFGPLAGLAQQYLFAWERRFGRHAPPS